jgi:hypothetical protein
LTIVRVFDLQTPNKTLQLFIIQHTATFKKRFHILNSIQKLESYRHSLTANQRCLL